MSITTQLGRISYLARHIRNFMPYITPRKIANAILNIIETKYRVVSLHSYPPYLKIESTPVCHLRCVTCSHSNPDFKRQFNASMNLTLERFKKIIDPVASSTLGVSLSFRGEPMLNQELPKIVRALDERVDVVAVVREERDPDRRFDVEREPLEHERPRE